MAIVSSEGSGSSLFGLGLLWLSIICGLKMLQPMDLG
jgi:hypothetical protein